MLFNAFVAFIAFIFLSGVQCSRLPSVCSLPPISGIRECRAYFPKWTYNQTLSQCVSYVYGGCDGTANLFDTEEECLQLCGTESNLVRRSADPCLLPKVVGPCKAAIPRFYFDSVKKNCMEFTYGGCQGNDNNFKSNVQCLLTCRKHIINTTPTVPTTTPAVNIQEENICHLPPLLPNARLCEAYIPMWTFNKDQQMCERFIYGGCNKSANLFETLEDCQLTCQSQWE